MIKNPFALVVITALTLFKYKGVIGLLSWLFPVRWIKGKAMFMMPYFYQGYFCMRSINRLKK